MFKLVNKHNKIVDRINISFIFLFFIKNGTSSSINILEYYYIIINSIFLFVKQTLLVYPT